MVLFVGFCFFAFALGEESYLLGLVSNLYNEGYGSGMVIENIEISDPVSGAVKFQFNDQKISSPAFSANQTMYSIPPWPGASSITEYELYEAHAPAQQQNLLQLPFCNTIATTLYSDTTGELYVLSSNAESEISSCSKLWRVYRVTSSGAVEFMQVSPLDGMKLDPLRWMTLNQVQEKFVFFIPDSENGGGSFAIQNKGNSTAVVSDSFPFTFYALDWMKEDQIIGPCVDTLNSFGLCVGNYSEGSVNQVVRLPPSYNPQLTATYYSRDQNLYVFAGQLDGTNAQEIQLYIIDTSIMDVFSSISHTLPTSYRLVGLYLFPTKENRTHSPPSLLNPTTLTPVLNSQNSEITLAEESYVIILVSIMLLYALAFGIALTFIGIYFYLHNKVRVT